MRAEGASIENIAGTISCDGPEHLRRIFAATDIATPPPAREAETCPCERSAEDPFADHLSWCPHSEPRTPAPVAVEKKGRET
jgi:hypothetical protein